MAYQVNWSTGAITIPKDDLVPVDPPETYSLGATDLWVALRAIEADESGIVFPTMVANVTPKTVAGVTLGRVVEVLSGYTLTFENGQYAVLILAGNTNVGDVVNRNLVSVHTANSAGLVHTAELEKILRILANKTITDPVVGTLTVFGDDGATPLYTGDLFEDAAGTVPYRGRGAERKERLQ